MKKIFLSLCGVIFLLAGCTRSEDHNPLSYEKILDEYVIIEEDIDFIFPKDFVKKIETIDEIKELLPTEEDWNRLEEVYSLENYENLYYVRLHFSGNTVPAADLIEVKEEHSSISLIFNETGLATVTFEESDKEPQLYRHLLLDIESLNEVLTSVNSEYF